MNPTKQREAIAEACGWTLIEDRSDQLMMPSGTYIYGYPPTGAIIGKKIPLLDYLNDLNAMHEAEKILWPMEPIFLSTYCELLMQSRYPNEWGMAWNYIHATAAQRAEAFLRTLNLWED